MPSVLSSTSVTKASADSEAKSRVNGCSTSAAKPSKDKSRAFIGGGVSTNNGMSGLKTFRGCGSKLSTRAGTSRRTASANARSSTA